MKKMVGVGALVVACGAGMAQFACSASSEQGSPAGVAPNTVVEELIGSVAVNSQSLDAIGSLGIVYGGIGGAGGFSGISGPTPGAGNATGQPVLVAGAGGAGGAVGVGGSGCIGSCKTPFYPQCTGTLVSANSVLTSRSCAALFQQSTYYGGSVEFAIGADATNPKRLIEVVDVEFAPALVTDAGSVYPDVAVLHLGESVTGVTPFGTAPFSDDLLGKQVATLGFGSSDLRYQSGTRRAGAVTVRASSGLLYPAIFGSFDAFYTYALNNGYYGGGMGAAGGVGIAVPNSGEFGVGGASSGSVPGGFAGLAAVAGGPSAGAGGPSAGAGGGAPYDYFREYLQQQYDSVQLGPGEAYLGGTDNDAQPCGADQGGPIVRKVQGQVRVFGVFSHTPLGGCDKGGVYATLSSTTKAFVDTAAKWKDPCAGITLDGKCAGTVATRCTSVTEGKRRVVKFDCALLNQVCVAGTDAQVACSDK